MTKRSLQFSELTSPNNCRTTKVAKRTVLSAAFPKRSGCGWTDESDWYRGDFLNQGLGSWRILYRASRPRPGSGLVGRCRCPPCWNPPNCLVGKEDFCSDSNGVFVSFRLFLHRCVSGLRTRFGPLSIAVTPNGNKTVWQSHKQLRKASPLPRIPRFVQSRLSLHL